MKNQSLVVENCQQIIQKRGIFLRGPISSSDSNPDSNFSFRNASDRRTRLALHDVTRGSKVFAVWMNFALRRKTTMSGIEPDEKQTSAIRARRSESRRHVRF
jgi:hypothetical protein